MDLSKFAIGTRWLDEDAMEFMVIGHDTDGISVTEKDLTEERYNITTWRVAEDVEGLRPYKEPKPDWKDNYPVGSKWNHESLLGIRQVVFHANKSDVLDDGILCAFVGNDGENVVVFYDESTADKKLTPYKAPASGVCWVNIYPEPARAIGFIKKDSADNFMNGADDGINDVKRIACVKVEWTEGEGL